MKLQAQRGSYRSSLFYIDINSFESFDSLADLVTLMNDEQDPQEKERKLAVLSTYFHEYFHFTQDVTTYFGLNTAWNLYDQLISIIGFIQKEKGTITIPIDDNQFKEVIDHYKILKSSFLDVTPTFSKRYKNDEIQIQNVNIYTPSILTKDLVPTDYFIALELVSDDGEKSIYSFGAVAVLETMVHLLQSRFFDTSYHSDFPYRSGILLANKICGDKTLSEETIFVLCDLSLMTPYPGFTFYELLNLIVGKELIFESSEELIKKGKEFTERRWNSESMFFKAKQGVSSIMNRLLQHDHFKKTATWFETLVEEGYQYRKSFPLFMLNIYRSEVPFGEELTKFFLKVGGPEVRNLDKLRWHKSPEKIVDDTDIFPGFLLALDSLLSLFLEGNKACTLFAFCKKSATPMPVDFDCLVKPWIKADLPKLCPYASFWTLYDLNKIRALLV